MIARPDPRNFEVAKARSKIVIDKTSKNFAA